jgi:hypothetical protein
VATPAVPMMTVRRRDGDGWSSSSSLASIISGLRSIDGDARCDDRLELDHGAPLRDPDTVVTLCS